jgi:3-isopropylmalate dehydratase small subunit
VNVGLPTLACKNILDIVEEGETLEVDWVEGQVKNLTNGKSSTGQPLPQALQTITAAGGVDVILTREGYLSPQSASDRR